MTDIIIVGAGPAGLTAAIYACRAGKSVVLFEEQSYGGRIINTPHIANYPGLKNISGFEFATTLYEQATELGAEVKFERVLSVEDMGTHKLVSTNTGKHEAKTVIIATGAKNRPLGIPKEQEFVGKGVSYCATCDGAFFKGKAVAVVGGGVTAIEDAEYLSDICSRVYIIHRRNDFRGDSANIEKLKNRPNVEFVLNSEVTGLIGDKAMEAVEITDSLYKVKRQLPVSALFVAIGQIPNNVAFQNLVDFDTAGYIASGEDCLTRTGGIFCAGDCRVKTLRQLTTAAADGAVAAVAAIQYINSVH